MSENWWPNQPVKKEVSSTFHELIKVFSEDDIDELPDKPFELPEGYEWSDFNPECPKQIDKLYEFLEGHYGEDDDHFFRFAYPKSILKWAITAPNVHRDLLITIRSKRTPNDKKESRIIGTLFLFPSKFSIGPSNNRKVRKMMEVNFLCLSKELRGKKLVHFLFREGKRRVLKKSFFHAIFTVGKQLPFMGISKKVFYQHRFLNIERCIKTGFFEMPSHLKDDSNGLEICKKQFEIKDVLKMNQNEGKWREMKQKDVKIVWKLYCNFMKRFDLYKVMNEDEFEHWFVPNSITKGTLYSYVVENSKNEISDFISFYYLPSSVIGINSKVKLVKEIYLNYYVHTETTLKNLFQKVLFTAKQLNFDVLNCCEIMDISKTLLKDLKFVEGTGYLYFYLMNYTSPIIPGNKIGLNML